MRAAAVLALPGERTTPGFHAGATVRRARSGCCGDRHAQAAATAAASARPRSPPAPGAALRKRGAGVLAPLMLAAVIVGVRAVCGMRLKPELSAALAPEAAEAPVQPTAYSLGYSLWVLAMGTC